MRFFDLHCDTASEMAVKNCHLDKNHLMVSLEKGKKLDEWVQTFAFWISDECRGDAAFASFAKQYAYMQKEMKAFPALQPFGETPKGECQVLLSVEGGAVLGGKIDRIQDLKEKGIRLLTLTWNAPNEIAAGALSEGGLTEFGKDCIRELERASIFLDVSHLNFTSFWDVAKRATKPFVATHSNSYALTRNLRNLKDEQIKQIVEAKGLIGLNFHIDFLEMPKWTGKEALLRHVDHFLKLGCEDVLAVGSDFDGADMPEDIADLSAIPALYQFLSAHFGEAICDRVFYQNAATFFARQ